MPNSSDIKAGSAFVQLWLEKSAFTKGLTAAGNELRAIGRTFQEWGVKLAAVGAMITAPLVAAAKGWAASGTELLRMSQRTGIAVEALSAYRYAAKMTGVDLGEVEASMKRMQKTLVTAGEGSQEARQSLARLHLTLGQLRNLRPDEQFDLIGERLAEISDPTARAGLAMEIFGRNATAIMPMLLHLGELRKEAVAMGAIAKPEDVAAAAALTHAYNLLEAAFKGLTNALGSAVGPVLTRFTIWLALTVKHVAEFIRQHKDLVVQVFRVGSAIGIAGAVLVAFGTALRMVAPVFNLASGSLNILARILDRLIAPLRMAGGLLASLGRSALSGAGGALSGLWSMGSGAASGVITAGRMMGQNLGKAMVWGFRAAGSGVAVSLRTLPQMVGPAVSAIRGLYAGAKIATGALDVGARAAGRGALALAEGFFSAVRGMYLLKAATPILGAVQSAGFAIGNAFRAVTIDIRLTSQAVWLGLKAAAGLAQTAWLAAVQGIKLAWLGLMAVPALLKTAWNATVNAVKIAWDAAAEGVKIAWSGLKAIPGLLGQAWDASIKFISAAWDASIEGVKTAWWGLTHLGTVISTAWNAAAATIQAVWSSVAATVAGVWSMVMMGLPGLMVGAAVAGAAALLATLAGGIAHVFSDAVGGAATAVRGSAGAMVDGVKTAVVGIGSLVRSLVSQIAGDFGKLIANFAGFGRYFSGWGSLLKGIFADVSAAASRLWTDATAAFQGVQDAMAAGDWAALGAILKDSLTIAWGEISNILGNHWDELIDRMTKAAAGIWFAMREGAAWLWMELDKGWGRISDGFEVIWAKALGAIFDSLQKVMFKLMEEGGPMMVPVTQAISKVLAGLHAGIQPIEAQHGDKSALAEDRAEYKALWNAKNKRHKKLTPDQEARLAELEKERQAANAGATVAGQKSAARDKAAEDEYAAGAPKRKKEAEDQAKAWSKGIKGLGTPGTAQSEIDAARKDLEDQRKKVAANKDVAGMLAAAAVAGGQVGESALGFNTDKLNVKGSSLVTTSGVAVAMNAAHGSVQDKMLHFLTLIEAHTRTGPKKLANAVNAAMSVEGAYGGAGFAP
jgi:hypothetical protein